LYFLLPGAVRSGALIAAGEEVEAGTSQTEDQERDKEKCRQARSAAFLGSVALSLVFLLWHGGWLGWTWGGHCSALKS
jgi:hypothetical protein